MGLTNVQFKDADATTTVTGGTALTLIETGNITNGGKQYIVDGDSRTSTITVTVKARPARLDNRTGKYTKTKAEIVFSVPNVSGSTGEVTFSTVRLITEFNPAMDLGPMDRLTNLAAQSAHAMISPGLLTNLVSLGAIA